MGVDPIDSESKPALRGALEASRGEIHALRVLQRADLLERDRRILALERALHDAFLDFERLAFGTFSHDTIKRIAKSALDRCDRALR
jgi:hypothetical protein